MKIRFSVKAARRAMAAAIRACEKSVDNATSRAVLALDDDTGRLSITCTDYESAIRAWLDCEVDDDTAPTAAVPGAFLLAALGALPDGDAQFRTDHPHAWLTAGRSEFTCSTWLADESPAVFPSLAQCERRHLSRDVLLRGFAATVPFVADNTARPALHFVYVEFEAGFLRFTATDGHRLGHVQLHCDGDKAAPAMISRRTADTLRAAMQDQPDAVPWIGRGDGRLYAVVGDVWVEQRLCLEAFPDYGRVIPDRQPDVVNVPRAALIDACRRCSVLRVETTICELGAGRLDLGVVDKIGTGSGVSDWLPLEGGGKKVKFGIDVRYLQQALDVFDAEHVRVQVIDQFSPILITCDTAPGVLHICMPMRL